MIRCLFTSDDWLSERLGKPCFTLAFDSNGVLIKELFQDVENLSCFIQTRIPINDIKLLHELLMYSFIPVAIGITFVRYSPPISSHIFVRPARPQDRTQVTGLAGKLFQWTRFHQDPLISQETAHTIQADWVENFFYGGRGDIMYVAEDNGNILGFHLALKVSEDTMVIDSIGVIPQAQKSGLGKALIDSAQAHLECSIVRSGTQLANISAVSFYEHAGFSLENGQYILHRHK